MTFIHIHPTSSQLYPALVIKHSYWKWSIEIIDLPDLSMVNLPIKPELIGGIPTPLKNMSSSDWIIIPTELGKIKAMFQTTNQDIIVLVGWHPIEKVDLRDLNMVNLHEFSYETRESPVIFHINHGFPMVFPWFSQGFPMVSSFLRASSRAPAGSVPVPWHPAAKLRRGDRNAPGAAGHCPRCRNLGRREVGCFIDLWKNGDLFKIPYI